MKTVRSLIAASAGLVVGFCLVAAEAGPGRSDKSHGGGSSGGMRGPDPRVTTRPQDLGVGSGGRVSDPRVTTRPQDLGGGQTLTVRDHRGGGTSGGGFGRGDSSSAQGGVTVTNTPVVRDHRDSKAPYPGGSSGRGYGGGYGRGYGPRS